MKHCSTPHLEKKENNCAEREGFLYVSLPLPLARSKENGNIESKILMGCEPCIIIPVYNKSAARKRLL